MTIRDLVRHALHHRPDHIVVGEVRGGEAADLLQALNTGHGGSLTTVHANNAESALSRIASCAMQGGGELPWEVTCRGVVDGIALVIHMTRREGRRFVEEAAFVQGYEAAGKVLVQTGRGIGDNGIWRIAKLNGILYLLDVGSKTTSFSSAFAGIFASN